ncbi:Cell cycle checkpoint protein rad17 [Terramyces sp. JEL0728]|nr:Cell cycle checkpoint protein rad17 [Terramyces sp. JEL0728]
MKNKKSKKRKVVIDSDEDPIIEISELKRKPRVSTQMLVTKHEPIFTAELAVHKKKIDQVRDWMQTALKSTKPNILVLSGPSGCGKTATVNCLAKELWSKVIEWENIIDTSLFDSVFDTNYGNETIADNFSKFLETNGTGSLLTFNGGKSDGNRRFLLVEDYPNVMHDKVRKKVQDAFQRYLENVVAVPIIIIVSDISNSLDWNDGPITKKELLPKEILFGQYYSEIPFNPIARTFVAKALNRICNLEAITLSRAVTDSVSVSCGGDIRTAINNLQFNNLLSENSVWFQKDADLSLFHAIGKILHCKRKVHEASGEGLLNPDLSYLKRCELPFNPEDIFDSLNIGCSFFLAFIHENYPNYCSPDELEHVTNSHYFSEADLMIGNSQSFKNLTSYCYSVAVRGLLFSWVINRTVPKLGFFHFNKPNIWQTDKCKRENLQNCNEIIKHCNENYSLGSTELGLSHNHSSRSVRTEIIPYLGIMNRHKSPTKFNNYHRSQISKMSNYNIKIPPQQFRADDGIEDPIFNAKISRKESASILFLHELERANRESLGDLYLLEDDIED